MGATVNAMRHAWDGIMSAGDWVGYMTASGYYIAQEFDFGDQICEIYGYAFYVIDGLHWIADFANKNEGMINMAANAAAGAVGGDVGALIGDAAGVLNQV